MRTRICGQPYSILRRAEPVSAAPRTCICGPRVLVSAGITPCFHRLFHNADRAKRTRFCGDPGGIRRLRPVYRRIAPSRGLRHGLSTQKRVRALDRPRPPSAGGVPISAVNGPKPYLILRGGEKRLRLCLCVPVSAAYPILRPQTCAPGVGPRTRFCGEISGSVPASVPISALKGWGCGWMYCQVSIIYLPHRKS